MNITIVNAKEKDAEAVWELGHASWELHPSKDSQWHTPDELKRWFNNPGRDILLVAKNKEKTVGLSLTSVFVDWAMLHDLYVDTKYRRLGIGKKLISKTVKKLRQKRIAYLGLVVNEKNEEGLEFYQANGFNKGYKFFWMYQRLKKI